MKPSNKAEKKAREKVRCKHNPIRLWAQKNYKSTREVINRHPAGAQAIVSILETEAEGPHGRGRVEDLYREELQTDAERRYFERCREEVRKAAQRPLTVDRGLSILPRETVLNLSTGQIRAWADVNNVREWAESKAALERSMGRDASAEVDCLLVKSFFEWLAQTKDNAQKYEIQTQEEAVRVAKERRSSGKGWSYCLSGAVGGGLPQLHIAAFFPKLCELVGATTWRQKQELKNWILNRDRNPLAMIPEPRGEGLLVEFVDVKALGYIDDNTHPSVQARAARVQNLKRGQDEQQAACAWDGFFYMVVNLDPMLGHRDELRPLEYRKGTMQQDLMQPHRMLKRIEDYRESVRGVSLVLKEHFKRPDVQAEKKAIILKLANEALNSVKTTILHDLAVQLVAILGPYIDSEYEKATVAPSGRAAAEAGDLKFRFLVPIEKFMNPDLQQVIKKKRLSKEVTIYMLGALLGALYSDTDIAGHYYSKGKNSSKGALFWIDAKAAHDGGDFRCLAITVYTKKETQKQPI